MQIAHFRFVTSGLCKDFEGILSRLQNGRQPIHLPSREEAWRRLPGTYFHPVPEFFLQTGGATDFSCPSGDFTLKTKNVCVMPSGVPHGERPRDLRSPYEIVVCWPLNDGFEVHRARESSGGRIQAVEVGRYLSARAKGAFRHLEEMAQPCSRRFYARSIRSRLTAFCIDMLEELERPEPELSASSLLIDGIERQARPLLADPDLSVLRLAEMAGCSADHLSRKFRQARGISLGQWIRQERLLVAQDLLRSRSLPVAEVGWACGFRAASYFIRVFRSQFGITPGAWRKVHAHPVHGPEVVVQS